MGILYNNNKYIELSGQDTERYLSFEDEVYFILYELFLNSESNKSLLAYQYCWFLSNGVSLYGRPLNFKYSNILMDIDFIKSIYNLIAQITDNDLDFNDKFDENDIQNMNDYMLFEEWNYKLTEIKNKIYHLIIDLLKN